MSDSEELDPNIEKALRNVPPATEETKNAHIAAALAEALPPRRSTVGLMNNRARTIGAVAVVLVLLLSGVSVFTGGTSPNNKVATPDTTLPPKTGADCAPSYLGAVGDVKYLTHNGTEFELWFQDFGIIDVIYNEQPCTNYGTINYWRAMVDRDLETSVPNNTAVCSYATEPIARFTDSRYKGEYNFLLVQTATGLSLHFEDRCDTPIASLELP